MTAKGKNEQRVRVDGRQLKLSNLEKPLFPADGLSKAQVVEYYLTMAPVILPHLSDRPLTLIRYPDGITEERFYQKNTPRWAPDWIKSVKLGDQTAYILATEKACLVWLANLASIEIHQMHVHGPKFEQPDYMVFDLDPADDSNFVAVADVAQALKEHVESYGYHPFVKTSGKKGLHLFLPLLPESPVEDVFEASKKIARHFIEQHEGTTLNLKKKARKGRMLIDIYRNRPHQTIASPYSLRAVAGAPVSMPLSWAELSEMESASEFTLTNARKRIEQKGDPWEEIRAYATSLHTQDSKNSQGKDLSDSDHHKSPEKLKEYSRKRDFSKTSEPASEDGGKGGRFVLQRHHASRLHYDLRLEQQGVLRSWAVPKGLPPRPGIKRLAVETEDHPLEYLHFEGEIPQGEYGGGTMWIFAGGTYTVRKQKEGSLHFSLESPQLNGDFRMYRTEDQHWLLERMDKPEIDWLTDNVDTMNARRISSVPEGNYTYEVKWDGIRALVALEDGEIKLHTRNQHEVTAKFPELEDASALRAHCGLFDGEIVHLDDEGRPQFQKIINRLKHPAPKKKQSGSIYCYLFDCLYLDGRAIVDEPLARRKEWVQDIIKKSTNYRLSETIENGEALLSAANEQGLEGIMAKKTDSTYQPGDRSDRWLKVKIETTTDCYIVGYTKGRGSRARYFGALHLANKKGSNWQYRGKVGTGFNESSLREIYKALQLLEEIKKPVKNPVDAEKDSTWVEPKIVVEVSYSSLTEDEIFRAAVFQRLRPDLSG